MEIGFIGLGRMGGNMALRLSQRGHRVVGFDLNPATVQSYSAQGLVGTDAWKDFVAGFETKPRVMWIMVPAGDPTTQAIDQLTSLGESGDIIVDGGNTNWKLALSDAARVKAHGMHYVDAGTSGGIWGHDLGYCLMVGAEPDCERTYGDDCERLVECAKGDPASPPDCPRGSVNAGVLGRCHALCGPGRPACAHGACVDWSGAQICE